MNNSCNYNEHSQLTVEKERRTQKKTRNLRISKTIDVLKPL